MKNLKKIVVKRISFVVMMFSIMLLAVSCPGIVTNESILKGVVLETVDRDGDVYADLAVDIDLGNIMLPSINIPVVNPYDPTHQYGELSLVGGFNGVNEISVAVNLSELLTLHAGPSYLPDGSPLPINELKDAEVVDIPILGGKHRIYLAADSGVAMMGFALTFRELDGVGKTIMGSDLIIPFTIGNFKGAAGFFTSPLSGKTGICAFIDIGEIIYPSELLEIKSMAMGDTMLKSAKSTDRYVSDKSILHFNKTSISKQKSNRFYRKLYKLHKKRSRLHLN